MPKSIYLSDSVLHDIEDVKTFFSDFDYEPTDIGILSAAVKVYKEKLKEKKRQESIEKTETEQK